MLINAAVRASTNNSKKINISGFINCLTVSDGAYMVHDPITFVYLCGVYAIKRLIMGTFPLFECCSL